MFCVAGWVAQPFYYMGQELVRAGSLFGSSDRLANLRSACAAIEGCEVLGTQVKSQEPWDGRSWGHWTSFVLQINVRLPRKERANFMQKYKEVVPLAPEFLRSTRIYLQEAV
jgi:hypothetical protein